MLVRELCMRWKRLFFSAAADRALGMVGQQISYIVKEKDAMIARNLDTEVKQATNSTNSPKQKPRTTVPRQLGEDQQVKRCYLPLNSQPFSSMNHYPLSKSQPLSPVHVSRNRIICSQKVMISQLPHTC